MEDAKFSQFVSDSARAFMADKSHWFSLSSNALLEFLLQPPAHVHEKVGLKVQT
jgi:hypothetical protein